jgi:hypothetical protein
MSDNSQLPIFGGAAEMFANEDIGGIKFPKPKLVWGQTGAANFVSLTNALPVQIRSSAGVAMDIVPVSGSVTVSSGSVFLSAALPAGGNNIGSVNVASMPALPAGGNTIGNVIITAMPSLPAGTNNIGDVDVATLPPLPAGSSNIGSVNVAALPALPAGGNAIGSVSVTSLPSLPAGTNNVGDVDIASMPAVRLDSNTVCAGVATMTPKWAPFAAAASGDNTIVPLVGGKKIRVLAYDLSPSGAVNAKWKSGSGEITGLYYMAAAGNGQARNFNLMGWFETLAGEALVLNLSAAVPCGGVVGYVEV